MKRFAYESLRGIVEYISSLFLSGLFTILPLTLTIVLIHSTFSIFISWLAPIQKISRATILHAIPHAEVLVVFLFVLLLGIIMRIFILRSLVHAFESFIFKIPLIRPVYSGIKQLISAFSINDKITFKQVVMVEFPKAGIFSLGFMTSELAKELSPDVSERYYTIFIPTTPNPTSGFFVILPESKLIQTSLNRQEAMAMIISGGIIQPDRFH